MADISKELAAILAAVYGREVRGSIHDAIERINDVSEKQLAAGNAISSPTSSSEGFTDGSLYINTDDYELWRCLGTDSWESLGVFKGDDGNMWYKGTVLTTTGSGLTGVPGNEGDFYINTNNAYTYQCVHSGDATTALWNFIMILGGGSSAIAVVNSLTSTSTTDALSAYQGKYLNEHKVEKPSSPNNKDILRYNGADWVPSQLSALTDQTFSGASRNPQSGMAINSKLDTWHKVSGNIQTKTVSAIDDDTQTVQFTNIDDSKCYELWYDTSQSSDTRRGEPPKIINCAITGSGTNCTMTYTVSVPVNPTYFRLVVKGSIVS